MNPTLITAYFAVISARYRMLLQYRAAAFAGLVTQLFWGAIRLMILAAFYQASSESSPMSLAAIAAYVWLGQAFLGLLPWNIDAEINTKMRDGSVAYELLRPLDFYNFWFCRTLAFRTATTTLRSIPLLAFAMLVLPLAGLEMWALPPPPTWLAFGQFLLSMSLAVILATAITMIMHITLFWTVSGAGADRILPAFVTLFSGMVIPLPMFPDWLQPFLELQPFRGLVDVPFRIYSGDIVGLVVWWDIAHQLIWCVLIIWLGRAITRRATRRLVVQGG